MRAQARFAALLVSSVVVAGFLTASVPLAAQVAVAPASCDADETTRKSVESSLRDVVQEKGLSQPSAEEVAAAAKASGSDVAAFCRALRVRAALVATLKPAPDGWAVELALVPADGARATISTRIAGRPSILPQVREMARALLQEAFFVRPKAIKPLDGASAIAGAHVDPAESEAGPYDPNTALALSIGVTLGGSALGGILIGISAGLGGGTRSESTPQMRADAAVGLLWTGVALIGASWLIGPAAGHFYSDFDREGWIGIILRGGTAATVGVAYGLTYAYYDAVTDEESRLEWSVAALLYSVIVPPLVAAISGIYDMVVAPRSARRANARSNASASQLSVAPMIVRNEGQLTGGGLSVGVAF
ncbi:MAG: hypothetical protein PHU25_13790 [Deltaproteobacteria bacterium]|nr:hypothetical protein [Deltaproteobacteria bacterium]